MLTLKEIMEATDEEVSEEVKQMLHDNIWDWVVYIEGGRVGKEPKNMLVNAYSHDTLTDANYR